VKGLALLSAAGFRTKNLSVRFRIFVYKAAKSLKKRGFCVKIPDFSSSDYKSTPMKSTFLRVVGEDLSPLAAKITAPTLLVYGKSDKATPPSFCRRYARLIRNSEAFVIRGSHFVMDDSPFEVASLINGFLPS
jgi:pimeloyl-ACP methyl ester carboxylesterase